MDKSKSKTVRVRLNDLEDLERARANLTKTVPGVADLTDALVVAAAIGALNEKPEKKMLPVADVNAMAAELANHVAAKAIVAVIKSFFEDQHPEADNILVEYQPVSGWLRVIVDDGEPLVFVPDDADQPQPQLQGVADTKLN